MSKIYELVSVYQGTSGALICNILNSPRCTEIIFYFENNNERFSVMFNGSGKSVERIKLYCWLRDDINNMDGDLDCSKAW